MVDLEFFEIIDKEREYKKYLTFHIEHVEEAFHRLIEPLKGKYTKEVDDAIDLCGQYIPLHDLSKLSKFEFDAYRKHFYPTTKEKDSGEQFDVAWEHHYQNNPHHPKYWTLTGKKQDMPLNFIFEMLCDWDSVSQWYDSDIIEWYDNKAIKEKDAMTPKTRELTDYWFNIIFRKSKIKY